MLGRHDYVCDYTIKIGYRGRYYMNRKDLVLWMDENPEGVCCPYMNDVGFAKCLKQHSHMHEGLDIGLDDHTGIYWPPERCPVCNSNAVMYSNEACPKLVVTVEFECGSMFTISTTGPEQRRSLVKVYRLSAECGEAPGEDTI